MKVTPFVAPPAQPVVIHSAPPAPRPLSRPLDFNQQLRALLNEEWEIASDGPSGILLKSPKKISPRAKLALLVGLVLVAAWGVGLLVIAGVLLDYGLQKRESRFIIRT